MKTAYFDCIAGVSGDMILAALLDAGLAVETLRQGLGALNLDGYEIQVSKVSKNGFAATKVDVLTSEDKCERRLAQIEAILAASSLSSPVKDRAGKIFARLCEEEAHIHGKKVHEVHLHELGALDTIVDVVGALVGLEALGVERVIASPVPLGRGTVRGAHGVIPVPAPATVALLRGCPVRGIEIPAELTTPTGAALVTCLVKEFGPVPSMRLVSVGYGAGARDLAIPNLLRLLIGEQEDGKGGCVETLVSLQTNIDDLNPEAYAYVMERLYANGALEVYLTGVHMKKDRPGTLLSVLAQPQALPLLRAIIFAETTTLGIRQQTVTRYALPRESRTVETPYGGVRVKVAALEDGSRKLAPEFEDCRGIAERTGVPLQRVYQAAAAAADDALAPVGQETRP